MCEVLLYPNLLPSMSLFYLCRFVTAFVMINVAKSGEVLSDKYDMEHITKQVPTMSYICTYNYNHALQSCLELFLGSILI